jgi:uncharacterized LabA/DUF88 family protein
MIFVKDEQKLIDTMLVADLVYLATSNRQECRVAVVSSDDDMLPGIRTAVNAGARVFQIHTAANYLTEQSYVRGLSSTQYTQGAL